MTEAKALECMLLRWSDTDKGRTVTLLLPDDGEPHPFRGLKTGAVNGQRLGIAVALINDQEEQTSLADASNREAGYEVGIDSEHKPLSSAAKPKRQQTLAEKIVCSLQREEENWVKFFQSFPFMSEYGGKWALVIHKPQNNTASTSEVLADMIREICNVSSRSEIIYDSDPAMKWREVYNTFELWLKKEEN